ncbi:MAG: hypothetical protein ACRD2L_06575 [Terriglobia bacterium]
MAKLTTYLCGSIQDVKDGGVYWRDKVTPKLQAMGITVLDPCKSECNEAFGTTIKESREQIRKFKRAGNFEAFDEHMARVIRDDLRQVNECNFMIVYWNQDYRHGGTTHEIVEAWQKHIPIYCVNYDALTGDKEMNDWILALIRQNGQMFENFGQLTDFIETRYKAEIKTILKDRADAEKAKEEAKKTEKKDEEKKDGKN